VGGLTKSGWAVEMVQPIDGHIDDQEKANSGPETSDDEKTETQAVFALALFLRFTDFVMVLHNLHEAECCEGIYRDDLDESVCMG
jgi:hypothetical protein